MDFQRVLTGKEKPLPIYKGVVACLENPQAFPDLLEPIYREAMGLDDDTLDRFRFSLMRLQSVCRYPPERGPRESDVHQVRRAGPRESDLRVADHGACGAIRGLTFSLQPESTYRGKCALVIPICADPINTRNDTIAGTDHSPGPDEYPTSTTTGDYHDITYAIPSHDLSGVPGRGISRRARRWEMSPVRLLARGVRRVVRGVPRDPRSLGPLVAHLQLLCLQEIR